MGLDLTDVAVDGSAHKAPCGGPGTQLRRNTDRYPHHRLAQLALAIVLLICIKLIDWRNRWSPPIR